MNFRHTESVDGVMQAWIGVVGTSRDLHLSFDNALT